MDERTDSGEFYPGGDRRGGDPIDLTFDDAVTRTSARAVKSSGIWAAVWGTLAAVPTGFASLYDWCVAQLKGRRGRYDLDAHVMSSWTATRGSTSRTLEFLGTGDGSAPVQGVWGYRTGISLGWWTLTYYGGDAELDAGWYFKTGNGPRLGNYVGGSWDSLSLSFTDASGSFTFVRKSVETSDTLALASQLAKYLPLTGGTLTGELAIGPNSSNSAKFEGDPSGAMYLLLRDSIGNMLYITGGKLFFRQYNWQRSVELYFPSQDGALALAAPTPTVGHLAALDANGNPTDAGWTAGDLARYALVAPTLENGVVTLADRAVNLITAAADETSIDIVLPAAVTVDGVRYCRDLIVDVDNSAGASDIGLELASDAIAYLDAGGARYLVAVADGDDLADLLTVAAGKRARLYFTETAQTATPTGGTSAVPVIGLQRLTVTVGGAA